LPFCPDRGPDGTVPVHTPNKFGTQDRDQLRHVLCDIGSGPVRTQSQDRFLFILFFYREGGGGQWDKGMEEVGAGHDGRGWARGAGTERRGMGPRRGGR